jgi:hypothetical protein
MRFFKTSAVFFAASALFLTACGSLRTEETAATYDAPSSYPNEQQQQPPYDAYNDGNYWAKDNLDLRAVGALLQKANDAEEFEYLLNSPDSGVNNLDLNGDGYADYISVREFDDRHDDERGLSLFSMFGPNEIQEIATVLFDRRGYVDSPGARILLSGNEQIYGDNYNYETNWLDTGLAIANWLFRRDRDDYYRSPYYYDYYPDNYVAYEVVETPIYRTRVEQYYYPVGVPVFIQTANPTITQIKIKSPYKDRFLNKIYSKLVKPTKQQIEFVENNPKPPKFVPVKNGKRNDVSDKRNNDAELPKGNEKGFNKPEKIDRANPVSPQKPNKFGKETVNSPHPVKIERPARVERQNVKSPKQGNNDKQSGGNNPGNGNGKGNNGGGKGNGKKN